MSYSLSPWLKPRFFITGTNRPLAGGLMYTYKAGTTTNATTYSDDSGAPNTNPIVLDTDGECNLYLDDDVIYRIILKNAAGVTQFDKDNISSNGAKDAAVLSFENVANLRLAIGNDREPAAQTSGYYNAGDGGGNSFYWDGTSAATDNGGTVIKPTLVGGAGRWLAINDDYVSVKQVGAKSDGVTDSASQMLLVESLGSKIVLENNSYLYASSNNLTFENGIEASNAHLNGIKYNDILTKNRDGTPIGIDMNHREDSDLTLGSNIAITSGFNIEAPISLKDQVSEGVEIIAHWYQDFGLEYTRKGGGGLTWYYWKWNFTTNSTYYLDRHPLQGWYRGDDANVLDWHCYWLREAGINSVELVSHGANTSTWSSPSSAYHWMYQLFTNCKNFKKMRYMLWGEYNGSAASIAADWQTMISQFYLTYDNFHFVRQNGKIYPSIYIFEGANHYINTGNTEASSVSFFQTIANTFKAAGYGGVAIFCRHAKSESTLKRKLLEAVDCLFFTADYGGAGGWLGIPIVSDELTYSAFADSWQPLWEKPSWVSGASYSVDDKVINAGQMFTCISNHVASSADMPPTGKNSYLKWTNLGFICRDSVSIPTSSHAVSPHPTAGGTNRKAAGSTPELFGKWLARMCDSVLENNAAPFIFVYNVSEWAEGGAGLIPNKQDGFGYLNAVSDVLSKMRKKNETLSLIPVKPESVSTVSTMFISSESTTITADYETLRLDCDSSRVMTSTPTIANGYYDGQKLRLMNINSSFILTLQDNATLANSNLFLTSTTITLAKYDSLLLEYVNGKGWVQIGSFINVI